MAKKDYSSIGKGFPKKPVPSAGAFNLSELLQGGASDAAPVSPEPLKNEGGAAVNVLPVVEPLEKPIMSTEKKPVRERIVAPVQGKEIETDAPLVVASDKLEDLLKAIVYEPRKEVKQLGASVGPKFKANMEKLEVVLSKDFERDYGYGMKLLLETMMNGFWSVYGKEIEKRYKKIMKG